MITVLCKLISCHLFIIQIISILFSQGNVHSLKRGTINKKICNKSLACNRTYDEESAKYHLDILIIYSYVLLYFPSTKYDVIVLFVYESPTVSR